MAKPLFSHRCHSLLAGSLASLLLACNAWAALGGDVASVASDQQTWGASDSQSYRSGATVHTQTLPNGLSIRQYVDAGGLVFAVAWNGPVLPDFPQLLGSYFSSYTDALRAQKRGVNVQSAALVLESGGLMRAFFGRAYLPAQLPTGLTAQDVR
jgi:hypothetical protein